MTISVATTNEGPKRAQPSNTLELADRTTVDHHRTFVGELDPLDRDAGSGSTPNAVTRRGQPSASGAERQALIAARAAGDSSEPGAADFAQTQAPPAPGSPSQPNPTIVLSTPTREASGWVELRVWAECFEDTQKARIACTNRMLRGGIHPDLFVGQIAALEAAEHQVALGLRRCYRRVVPASIIEWQHETRGIGEHMLARLLGTLGHPVLAQPYHWEGEGTDRELIADAPFERTVGQLWSYCGVGDATRKRRKGMTADDAMALGNPRCKMLVRLLAEASMKSRGPHRVDYDRGRALYLERSDWTDGHRHAAALRLAGKAILADLWDAAR